MSRHMFRYPNECKFFFISRQLNCMKDLLDSQDLASAGLRTSLDIHEHVTHFAESCADEHQLRLFLIVFCFATYKWCNTCRADGVPSKLVRKVHQFDLICFVFALPEAFHILNSFVFPAMSMFIYMFFSTLFTCFPLVHHANFTMNRTRCPHRGGPF